MLINVASSQAIWYSFIENDHARAERVGFPTLSLPLHSSVMGLFVMIRSE